MGYLYLLPYSQPYSLGGSSDAALWLLVINTGCCNGCTPDCALIFTTRRLSVSGGQIRLEMNGYAVLMHNVLPTDSGYFRAGALRGTQVKLSPI